MSNKLKIHHNDIEVFVVSDQDNPRNVHLITGNKTQANNLSDNSYENACCETLEQYLRSLIVYTENTKKKPIPKFKKKH